MARRVIFENHRVEVHPASVRGVIYLSATQPSEEEKLRRRCDEIVAAIRRHIDDVESVNVAWDRSHVCEHCGSGWTETSQEYNGGCCSLDQSAFEAPARQETL